MNIGKNISSVRKQRGLSQEELANSLNVSRQAVSLWETDQTIPSLDNLKAMSEILNVSVAILTGEQQTNYIVNVENEQANKEKQKRYLEIKRKADLKEAKVVLLFTCLSTLLFCIPLVGLIFCCTTFVLSISSYKKLKLNFGKYLIAISAVYTFASIVILFCFDYIIKLI